MALALVAARAASTKNAQDPVILAMGELLGVVDAFVILSATNSRQLATIVEEVERVCRVAHGEKPRAVEGSEGDGWVLMDYGAVVVHVFLEETRAHYAIERLWGDAPRIEP